MPLRQVAHLGHAVGDLLAQQHPAAARLGALADHDLDRVGAPQVVGVHAVARRQQLVDQRARSARAPRAVMPPSPVVVLVPDRARAAPERLLGRRRERAEAHAGDRDRDLELHRSRREAGPERRRRCRSARGSPRAGSATRSRRGTAGRRSAARGAWRQSRGCRRCPRGPSAGSRGSSLRSKIADSRRPGRRSAPRPSVLPGVVDVGSCRAAGPSRSAGSRAGSGIRRRRPPEQARDSSLAVLVAQLLLDAVGAQAARPRRGRTGAPRRSSRRARRPRRRTRPARPSGP